MFISKLGIKAWQGGKALISSLTRSRGILRSTSTCGADTCGLALKALEQDTVQIKKYLYETSIPLHDTRSFAGNERYIRELSELGLEGFCKKRSEVCALETINFMNKADGQFARLKPLGHELTTYRGIQETPSISSRRYIDKLYNTNIGNELVLDSGYSYSALSKSEALKFTGDTNNSGNKVKNVLIEMHYKPGTPISITSEYGGEALTPREMRYIVKDKKINSDGSMYLKLENIVSDKPYVPIEKPPYLLDLEKLLIESGEW